MTQTNIITRKEGAKIEHSGCGGFLNPPTHPEHDYSVVSTRRDQFILCLTSASTDEYITDSTRIAAKKLLDDWVAPDIDSDEVQDWIHQVLGYFNNCYSPDGQNRKVSDCKITAGNPFEIGIMRHLGVLLILKYYPEYQPRGVDFLNAYWGQKKEQYKEVKGEETQEFEQGSKWKRDGNVHVVANTTNMMVIYYDETDKSLNPKLLKDTKLVFGMTHKEIKK